jgi:hypothetical protein
MDNLDINHGLNMQQKHWLLDGVDFKRNGTQGKIWMV